jgi:NAD+--dinitrogen-reductase ADP-D-ribosyltransferase
MSIKPHPSTLPLSARHSLNRCNLPSVILGSLTFQLYPSPLYLDGVRELHKQLFETLDLLAQHDQRAKVFADYMSAAFLLNSPEQAGLETGNRFPRPRADYRRMLTGWVFDSNAIEGAILKGWVESRFGLLPRYHNEPIDQLDSDQYDRFQNQRMNGLYNTNNLEGQIDVLYTWCQYELKRTDPAWKDTHIELYRGLSHQEYQGWTKASKANQGMLLLNNLNSFTDDPAQAETFGDMLISVRVPTSKILYYPGLIPGLLQGEQEYMIIGGVYQVERSMVLS